MSQAVAEGLSQFLGGIHKVGAKKDPARRVGQLHAKGVITEATRSAFLQIWGDDRNTFHHLNSDVPTNHQALELRAEECVKALPQIESEVFSRLVASTD